MQNKKLVYLTQAALIAALYTVLCIVFQPISYGAIQCRIAEALTILPFFTPAAIPGLAIGCLISNLYSNAGMLDIIFGTLATLLGAIGSYQLRRWKYLVPVSPIFFNTLIIPYVIKYAYMDTTPIYLLSVNIFVGEVVSCGLLGILLLLALNNYKRVLFTNHA